MPEIAWKFSFFEKFFKIHPEGRITRLQFFLRIMIIFGFWSVIFFSIIHYFQSTELFFRWIDDFIYHSFWYPIYFFFVKYFPIICSLLIVFPIHVISAKRMRDITGNNSPHSSFLIVVIFCVLFPILYLLSPLIFLYLLRVPGKKEENQNDQNSEQTKKSLFKSLLGFNFLQRNLSPEIRKYSLYQKYFKIWPELRIGREQFAVRVIWLLLIWFIIFVPLRFWEWIWQVMSRLAWETGIFHLFIPFIIQYIVGLTFYAIFYKRFRDISLNDSVNFKTLYWIFIFIQIWIMGVIRDILAIWQELFHQLSFSILHVVYAYVALLLLVFVYFGSLPGQTWNNKNGPDPSNDTVWLLG